MDVATAELLLEKLHSKLHGARLLHREDRRASGLGCNLRFAITHPFQGRSLARSRAGRVSDPRRGRHAPWGVPVRLAIVPKTMLAIGNSRSDRLSSRVVMPLPLSRRSSWRDESEGLAMFALRPEADIW